MMKVVKIKTTDIENLTTAIFCRRKSHIGEHLRRHCRLPMLIPMAATSQIISRTNKPRGHHMNYKNTGSMSSMRKLTKVG